MNLGITGTGTETHGASPASYAGMPHAPNLPGLPSVVQMDPQTYIKRLLAENGGITDAPNGDFFSLTGGQGGSGGEGEGHQKSNPGSTILKWGVGILAAIALWKLVLTKKTGSLAQSTVTKLRSFFNKRKGTGLP